MKKTNFLLIAICWVLLTAPSARSQGTTTYPTTLDDGVSLPVPVDAKVATLTAGLTSSATTATVNSTTGFPSAGLFMIESEEVAYTGTTSTTFTGMTRGFAGTTARPHTVNMQIRSGIFSAHITAARGATVEMEQKLGTGASNAADAPTGNVLTKRSDGTTGWAFGAGTGDAVGPASAVDNRIAVFDGTTGKLLKDGGSAIGNLQPLDPDLTALAALSPTNDDIVQRKSGAWTNRTLAQLKIDLNLSGTNTGDQDLSGYVPTSRTVNGHALSSNVTVTPTDLALAIGVDVEAHDADLTTIAGLSPSNDDIIQRKAGVWTSRTVAQLKTDFGLATVATSGSAADLGAGTLPAARMPALTGDIATSVGAVVTTLATVNSNVGSFGSATQSLTATVNGKGLITAISAQTVTPAWSSITSKPTTIVGYGITDAQPLDSDLTTIAGLTATTDNFIVSVSSAWASRTPAQVKTTLSLNNLDNTSDASKPVSTVQQTALDLKANLASPTLTGTPAAPTAAVDTSTTQLATTAYVVNQTYAKLVSPTFTGTPTLPTGTIATTQSAADSTTKLATTAFVTTADNLKANLVSPTFTGTPAAPTAAVDTNTTQVATTAFVVGQTYAKLASPTFTGTPTLPTGTIATTQSAADSTTKVATTAFVTTADNLKANLASPTFTGTPTLPTGTIATTQAAGDNSTKLATTAFVSRVPSVRAYNSGNISVADSTFVTLTFDAEYFDTDTIHSTVSNTSRLTATTAGTYQITCNLEFATSALGYRRIDILYNGATVLASHLGPTNGSNSDKLTVTTLYALAATDYVEVRVYQTSTATINVNAVGNYTPDFMMFRVGP